MSRVVWTKDRISWMRDVGLPTSSTLAEALKRACDEFGDVGHIRTLQTNFRRHFGVGPGQYLGIGLASGDNPEQLRRQVKRLQSELRAAQEETLTTRQIKSILGRIADHQPDPPKWVTDPPKQGTEHGVPTLFLSDVHFGETVAAAEVHGVNRYNSQIAADRIERIFNKATHLISDVLSSSNYPGVVLALGGDLISGTIREEIRESNDLPVTQQVLRLADLIIAGIAQLREAFGKVFVPAVVGNHGRIDRKPRCKGGVADNFEYLLLHLIARAFDGDKRVVVKVADSFDTDFRIFRTKYKLTHGDQFRGGSGISGPLLPWTLGDHRLRKQAQSMAAWHDTPTHDVLLMGHWHSLFFGPSFVVNGAVKGFDEYALKSGFSYEPPRQACWLTHPDHGITIQMPVYAERAKRGRHKATWIEVAA